MAVDGAAQLPSGHQIACQHQVGDTAGKHIVGMCFGIAGHKVHHVQESLARGRQAPGHGAGSVAAGSGEFALRLFDLRRDGARCAYCAASANTIDHVIPKSRGGAESWENLVACCFKCNNIKSDRTPQEMGWRLRITPRMPAGSGWFAMGLEHRDTAWDDYLAPAA